MQVITHERTMLFNIQATIQKKNTTDLQFIGHAWNLLIHLIESTDIELIYFNIFIKYIGRNRGFQPYFNYTNILKLVGKLNVTLRTY